MPRKRATAGEPPELRPAYHPERSSTGSASRPRGRPRSTASQTAILTASIAMVREVGYDALAIEAVAARAGVGKATVYRHWASKELLVAEAVGRLVQAVPTPDTGHLADDVLALMRVLVRMYADPGSASLLPALVAAMARSPHVAEAVRTGMLAEWRAAMRAVFARGAARGELRAGADVDLALELLSGPPFYRYLMLGARVDERYVRAIATAALATVTAAPEASRHRARSAKR